MIETLRELAGAGLSTSNISRGIEHEHGVLISPSALGKAARRFDVKLRNRGSHSRWSQVMIDTCLQLRETMTAKELAAHLSNAFDISIKSETVRNFLNDRGLPPKPERPWAIGAGRLADPPVPPRPQWGEYRSLTAYLFGDPQPGRSALDQRAGASR